MKNEVSAESQPLEKKEKLKKLVEQRHAEFAEYVGQSVNWTFDARADENSVRLRNTWDLYDVVFSHGVSGHLKVVISHVKDQLPGGHFLDLPLELKIPRDISKEEAMQLPMEAKLQGTITDIRIEESYLLPQQDGIGMTIRIILDDVRLSK